MRMEIRIRNEGRRKVANENAKQGTKRDREAYDGRKVGQTDGTSTPTRTRESRARGQYDGLVG